MGSPVSRSKLDSANDLAMQARDACVAHLDCNGSPVGSDIDPTTEENQACTVPSAQSLCDEVVLVLAPALAALNDERPRAGYQF